MDRSTLDNFAAQISGVVVLPADTEYEEARQTYSDKEARPAIIVRPADNDDIVATIAFAKETGLLLSVRSGKHSVAGFSTNNGGIVLDMSGFSSVAVLDEASGLVRIGTGARWGDVAARLADNGLAISSGDTVSVGVGGLTLGGGIGWMVRKYGFTIDSLSGAEVILADGSVVRADEKQNSDLLWALKGGGGNFGVVTYFDIQAHPIGKVFKSTLIYGIDDLKATITGWRDHMRTADENLTSFATLMPGFGDFPASIMIMSCYAAEDEAAGNAAIEPLKHLGELKSDSTALTDYAKVLEEAHPPEGVKFTVKNMFARTLSEELIAALDELCCKPGSPIIQLRFMSGAADKVEPAATAVPHRGNEVFLFAGLVSPLDGGEEAEAEGLRKWDVLTKHSTGTYGNFLSTNSEDDVNGIYPSATYAELAKIKRRYDPANLFHHNYNIKPAVE